MADDASLDDFLDAGESGDEGNTEDSDAASADATSEDATTAADDEAVAGDADVGRVSVDPSTVEPATTTYGWSSEAVDCERCEESVDRRWRDGDALVCADCKEW